MKLSMAILIGTMLLLGANPYAKSPLPPLVNYQGKLTDEGGEPLATGKYDLYFRIWNHPTESVPTENLLWGEKHVGVPVVRGAFNVILGSGKPVEEVPDEQSLGDAFLGATRFMGVAVGSGNLSAEVQPRQRILSVPYALAAGNDVPLGTVIPWVPNEAIAPDSPSPLGDAEAQLPSGWKVCCQHPEDDASTPAFDERNLPDLNDNRFLMGGALGDIGKTGEPPTTHTHGAGTARATGQSAGESHIQPGGPVPAATHAHCHPIRSWNRRPETGTAVPLHVCVVFIIRVQ